jgi:hypothetical protein
MNLVRLLLLGAFLLGQSLRGPAKDTVEGTKTPPGEDLFTAGLVPHIRIEIPPEGMEVLRSYHQVWGQPRPERVDVRATLREGTRIYTNVTLHLKGSYSFQPIDAKPSFTLNFEKAAEGQKFHGLGKLHLNNSVQDPSYLSEALAREMFREVGVPSTRIGHALVEFNGRKLGLYVLAESWGKSFLKQHFASTTGNLYDGGSGGDITKTLKVDSGDSPENRSDVTNLIAACKIKDPTKRLGQLDKLLNLDQFIGFAATEIFLVHWDGYSMGPNNYRLFHDATLDKMIFMPHGLDQTFGTSNSPEMSITPHLNGSVAKAVMTVPEGRRRFLERLAQLSTNQFRFARLDKKLNEMAAQLRPALAEEPQIFSEFNSSVQALESRMARRCQSVTQQLAHPNQPLALVQDTPVPLTSWRFKTGPTKPASGRRSRADNQDLLEVVGRGADSTGSWRTLVLLEKGFYEFSGKARVQGFENTTGATNGVILRASGERSTSGISTSSEWATLTYPFEVRGIEDVELVCEFRGRQGSGQFDAGSMRLVRKSGPPAKKQDP